MKTSIFNTPYPLKQSLVFKHSKKKGFTLIEVMVALSILSVLLITLSKAITQNVNTTNKIQQKFVAQWIAQNQLTKLRYEYRNKFINPFQKHETVYFGNNPADNSTENSWQVTTLVTVEPENDELKKVKISVQKEGENSITEINSFLSTR